MLEKNALIIERISLTLKYILNKCLTITAVEYFTFFLPGQENKESIFSKLLVSGKKLLRTVFTKIQSGKL